MRDCAEPGPRATSHCSPEDGLSDGRASFLDFMENTNRGAATTANPTKNIELAAKWRSEIQEDRTKEMSDDRPGTNKKNIVTKPLSFSVAVRGRSLPF
jgi:hypothetical protein